MKHPKINVLEVT